MKYRIYGELLDYEEFDNPEDVWKRMQEKKQETGKNVDVYLMTDPPACIATDNSIFWTNLADTMNKSAEHVAMVAALQKVIPDPQVYGCEESLPSWTAATGAYQAIEIPIATKEKSSIFKRIFKRKSSNKANKPAEVKNYKHEK